MVKISNLTESLDRKYLSEAYDESFPKWLKDRLNVVKEFHKGNYYKTPRDQRPEYYKARDEKYLTDSDKSLFSQCLSKGIDLTNTQVIEGPIPLKRTDPRLHEPNMPVWLFTNGQVYIEGVNDSEIFKLTGKAFRYAPVKDKLANAKAFAYIDGSKINPTAITDKRTQRREIKYDIKTNLPNYARVGTKERSDLGMHNWANINGTSVWDTDKSGYLRTNPVRYKDEIKKLLGDKIYEELQKYFDEMVELKRQAVDFLDDIDLYSDNNPEAFKFAQTLMSDLQIVSSTYQAQFNDVEYTVNNRFWDDDVKKNRLGRIVRELRADKSIKRLKEKLKPVAYSYIDWD